MQSSISPEEYRRVKEILASALEIAPAGRPDFLDIACSGDDVVRAEVESLLAFSKDGEGFLDNFSGAQVVQDSFDRNKIRFGQKLDNYRLEKEIGRGGMGIVFLAEREDFHQQVAIKLIKRGMDSDAILERFTREREILAALTHPYIARLTDGGTTPDNLPFFVMEYVDGLPVNEYCKLNSLSEREILILFRKICEAVSFAHQKLIVHRDLKPSNILVTADGTPKLLDFGIAKLLNSTDGTNTETNQRVLTPDYASPEQLRGEPVDTTSDVYSLGVILYELLTGAKPYQADSRDTNGSGPINKRLLKGDAGNILGKSLDKEVARRYRSVEQFSEDIRRCLEGLPVSAHRNTVFYRGFKFIKRNKLAAAAVILVFATLLGGIITTSLQRLRAENDERDNRRLLYAAHMSLAYQAWEANNVGRAIDLIEAQKNDVNSDDLHGFEWRLLWRLTHDGARVLTPSAAKLLTVAFSPDGSRIAVASLDGKARVWDAATELLLTTLDAQTSGETSIDFSPDGNFLAAGDEKGVVRLWDLETGKPIRTYDTHQSPVTAIAFSPDGQILVAASGDRMVRLWNINTGEPIATLSGHNDIVTAIVFAPGGKTFATASHDHTIKLWDVGAAREIVTLRGHSWWVLTLAFSPDAKTLVSSGSDGAIKFWDTAGWRERGTIPSEGFTVDGLNFSPDGKTLAIASADNTIKICDPESRTIRGVLRGHTDSVRSVTFAPDGRTLASISSDQTVRLWNLDRQPETATLDSHTDWAWSLAFSPDGQTLATASKDATVKLWNVANESVTTTLQHAQWVNGVTFSPDGTKVATASDDTFVRVWNPATGQILLTLNDNANIAECVAFSPDGTILAAGNKKGDIKLWDAATGEEMATFTSPNHHLIWSLAFSPDGKLLASGEGGETDLNIPSGRIANIWDIATGRTVATLDGHLHDVRAVAFSPDGKTLATGSYDRTIKFWDAANWKEITALKSDRVQSLAFSADGTRLVSGSSNKTVKIWDVPGKQELCTLTVPTIINSVAFSPDNQILAAAGSDNKVRLWLAPGEN